jgi:hypothetical protein
MKHITTFKNRRFGLKTPINYKVISSNNNLSPPMMTMGFVEQEVYKKSSHCIKFMNVL